MSPPKNRGDGRKSMPLHPGQSQPQNGTGLRSPLPDHVGPRTTIEEWDRIEQQYWEDAEKASKLEDHSMGERYRITTAPLKAAYQPLLDRRARLKEELDAVNARCEEIDNELTEIDMNYFEAKDIIVVRRADQKDKAEKFFSTYKAMARRQALGLGNDQEKRQLQAAASDAVANSVAAIQTQESALRGHVGNGGVPNGLASSQPPRSSDAQAIRAYSVDRGHDDTVTGVNVYNSDGTFIAPVKKIDIQNRHIRNILQIQPKRDVVVRDGRKFNQETMASIYEPSDVKGAKWLSCMIQATGEEQDVPCEPCRNKTGTWNGCVIVGGVDFPRCANCEWNRQGCVGSSYHQDRSQDPDLQQPLESPHVVGRGSAPPSREGSSRIGFTAVNSGSMRQDSANSTPMRTTLPSAKGDRNRLPSTAPSLEYNESFQGAAVEESLDAGINLTIETTHLEDDGEVFTAPDIMRGVPLKRISPTHPYWEKTWDSVEAGIQAKLSEWQTKLAECMVSQPKKRFLAQRQVNRGKAILEFLEKGPIHPYQLVGKRYISKALISYDTVFRLAQVIDELPKLGVEMDPVAWLRERMHEVYSEQGEAFSLSRTIHDLYRDPKLQFLRNRAGFGNIGRPCGVKKGMTSKYPGGIRPKVPGLPPPPRAKRSSTGMENKVPNKKSRTSTGTPSPSPYLKSPQIKSETLSPQAPHSYGPPQTIHWTAVQAPQSNGFIQAPQGNSLIQVPQLSGLDADDGYTSTDSATGEPITARDWRIGHLKTDDSQPHPGLTQQYWHFVDKVERPYFEHQIVMNDGKKNGKWNVYPEPHNFHLYVDEIKRIQYSSRSDCLKIIVHTKSEEATVPSPRGRILLHFLRPNTIKRFKNFVKFKAPMNEVSKDYLDHEWEVLDVPYSDIEGHN